MQLHFRIFKAMHRIHRRRAAAERAATRRYLWRGVMHGSKGGEHDGARVSLLYLAVVYRVLVIVVLHHIVDSNEAMGARQGVL